MLKFMAMKLSVGIISLCFLVFTEGAHAGAIGGAFSGTFLPGAIDQYGFFGTVGLDLSGQPISGAISYSAIDPITVADRGPDYYYVLANPNGGSNLHSPWTGRVTANGTDFSVFSSFLVDGAFLISSSFQPQLFEFDVSSDLNISSRALSFQIRTNVNFGDHLKTQSAFNQVLQGFALAGPDVRDLVYISDGTHGEVLAFTIDSVSSVPLPPSWVAMVFGLWGLFLAAHRRPKMVTLISNPILPATKVSCPAVWLEFS